MDNIQDILDVMEESQELVRRLEALQQRIGIVGSPELCDIGGTVTMFLSPGGGVGPPGSGSAPQACDGFAAG